MDSASENCKMTSNHDANRSRTRQRIPKPAPALEVPDIDQDAAERKRVLNVLAQRRYRELQAPPFTSLENRSMVKDQLLTLGRRGEEKAGPPESAAEKDKGRW